MKKDKEESIVTLREIFTQEEHRAPYLSIPLSILRSLLEIDSHLGCQMAILLSYFIGLENLFKPDDGWFFKLQAGIENDIGFKVSTDHLRKMIRALEDLKLIFIKRKGKQNWYKLNRNEILKLIYPDERRDCTPTSAGIKTANNPDGRRDIYSKSSYNKKNNKKDKCFQEKTHINKNNDSIRRIDYIKDMPLRKQKRDAKKNIYVEYLIKLALSDEYPGMPKMAPRPSTGRYQKAAKFFDALEKGTWDKEYVFDKGWKEKAWMKEDDYKHKFKKEEIEDLINKAAFLYKEGSRVTNKGMLPHTDLTRLLFAMPNLKNKKYEHKIKEGGYSWLLSCWKRNPYVTEKARDENIDNSIRYRTKKTKSKTYAEEWEEEFERYYG